MLSAILPRAAICCEQIGALNGSLFPQEAACLKSQAVLRRQREFASGRTCARAALQKLGAAQRPILKGMRGEPLWPTGFVGSITHCDGYCAAAVASHNDILSIGIDAEPNEPLPQGVLELIAVERERAWLANAPQGITSWDRILFSIKESIYKAWFPLAQCWLDFDQAAVTINTVSDTFSATILQANAALPKSISGKYLLTPTLILTSAWVPKT